MGRFVDCRWNIREEASQETLRRRRATPGSIDAIASAAVENLYPAAEINRLQDKDTVVGVLDHDSIALRGCQDRTAASRRAPVTSRSVEDVNRPLVGIRYIERMSCFIQIHDRGQAKGDIGRATSIQRDAGKDDMLWRLAAARCVRRVTAPNVD